MAEAQKSATDNSAAVGDDDYWKGTPDDNQHVYKGFLGLLKFAAVAGALLLIFLAIVRPAPL